MRDPMTMVARVWKPIPSINKKEQLGGRHNPKFGWQVRIYPFAHHTYISPFVYLFGYELYFSSFIEIWHRDPKGDIGPPCHGRKWWKLHIHHMSISPSFWYDFRQKHITRCAWCGKKSNKEQGRVNHSDGRTVYHSKCMNEQHRTWHAHDPAECYNCSGEAVWKNNRKRNARAAARALFSKKG